MTPSVYIETTIFSYLTAWPSRDIVRLAQQQIAQDWWNSQRGNFDLYVSELVIRESQQGDAIASAERLRLISGIPSLDINNEAEVLAVELVAKSALPKKAAADALHIAVAAVNRINFVLTWNCRHLANAMMQPAIQKVCASRNVLTPIPETLQEIEP
jgi:hypothetical protein